MRGVSLPTNPFSPACYDRQMSVKAERLFEEARKLPQRTRANLAGRLILSLDEKNDKGVEAAWSAELDRRLDTRISLGSRSGAGSPDMLGPEAEDDLGAVRGNRPASW